MTRVYKKITDLLTPNTMILTNRVNRAYIDMMMIIDGR